MNLHLGIGAWEEGQPGCLAERHPGQWSLRAEVCLAPRLCRWQAEVDRREDILLHVVPGGIASQGQQDIKEYTLSFKRIWASIGVGKE